MIEAVIGFILALLTLFLCRKYRLESWLYSASLFALPTIYMAFGFLAKDQRVILNEFLVGIPFFIAGYIFLTRNVKLSAFILAMVWFGHAYYDIDHDRFFVNNGTPNWYPLLCAAYDGVIGVYLIYLATTLKHADLKYYQPSSQV